ncbi:MAG: class I SAM-dependent methyltransferase [Candidatus Gracilibacteria bacterium]|jgi:SAM-dependent methyltransferase
MNVFADYSKFYDLLYYDKDYQKEASYILDLITKNKPNTKTILELGCGTGIHASIIAKSKISVTGIDQSAEMIKSAYKRASKLPAVTQNKLDFQIGDIRYFNLDKTFDTCLALFHIISYLTSNKDVSATLQNVKKHLKRDGLFIFDCWYGPAVLNIKPAIKEKVVENKQIKVVRVASPETHPNECVVDVNYHLIAINKENNECAEIQEQHKMRYFFKPELEQLLLISGFKLIHTEEWLTKKTPGADTWGVTFIARAT